MSIPRLDAIFQSRRDRRPLIVSTISEDFPTEFTSEAILGQSLKGSSPASPALASPESRMVNAPDVISDAGTVEAPEFEFRREAFPDLMLGHRTINATSRENHIYSEIPESSATDLLHFKATLHDPTSFFLDASRTATQMSREKSDDLSSRKDVSRLSSFFKDSLTDSQPLPSRPPTSSSSFPSQFLTPYEVEPLPVKLKKENSSSSSSSLKNVSSPSRLSQQFAHSSPDPTHLTRLDPHFPTPSSRSPQQHLRHENRTSYPACLVRSQPPPPPLRHPRVERSASQPKPCADPRFESSSGDLASPSRTSWYRCDDEASFAAFDTTLHPHEGSSCSSSESSSSRQRIFSISETLPLEAEVERRCGNQNKTKPRKSKGEDKRRSFRDSVRIPKLSQFTEAEETDQRQNHIYTKFERILQFNDWKPLKIDVLQTLQDFWNIKCASMVSTGVTTMTSSSQSVISSCRNVTPLSRVRLPVIFYDDDEANVFGEDPADITSFVTLPGGSCFASLPGCRSTMAARHTVAKTALLNSVFNEHPQRIIDETYIKRSLEEAIFKRDFSKKSGEEISEAGDEETVTGGLGVFQLMLEQNKGRTLMEFQELMTLFQLLHWNGSLKAMRERNCTRKEVLEYYTENCCLNDATIRKEMSLDWETRERQHPGSLKKEIAKARNEVIIYKRKGRELRFSYEKYQILKMAKEHLQNTKRIKEE